MSTIAYRSGLLAADSHCSEGSRTYPGGVQKLYRLNERAIVGIAGDADSRELLELLSVTQSPDDLPPALKLYKSHGVWEFIIVFKNGSVYAGSTKRSANILPLRHKFYAIGSGSDLALGAMEMGADAEQAVKVAAKFDQGTKGPVRSMRA